MQNLLLVFDEENWHHLFAIREPFLPVLVVQVRFYILLLTVLVLLYDELLKRILQDTAKNPFLKDLEVGEGCLFKQKREKVPDRHI